MQLDLLHRSAIPAVPVLAIGAANALAIFYAGRGETIEQIGARVESGELLGASRAIAETEIAYRRGK